MAPVISSVKDRGRMYTRRKYAGHKSNRWQLTARSTTCGGLGLVVLHHCGEERREECFTSTRGLRCAEGANGLRGKRPKDVDIRPPI